MGNHRWPRTTARKAGILGNRKRGIAGRTGKLQNQGERRGGRRKCGGRGRVARGGCLRLLGQAPQRSCPGPAHHSQSAGLGPRSPSGAKAPPTTLGPLPQARLTVRVETQAPPPSPPTAPVPFAGRVAVLEAPPTTLSPAPGSESSGLARRLRPRSLCEEDPPLPRVQL